MPSFCTVMDLLLASVQNIMLPGGRLLKYSAGGGAKLDDDLLNINLEAAAIIAAHQYMSYIRRRRLPGLEG